MIGEDEIGSEYPALEAREYNELVVLHQQLTREIQHYETYSLQIVGAVLVLVTATTTVAFSQLGTTPSQNSISAVLFVTAAFTAAAGMLLSFNREANIMMNASYLRNVVEPHFTHLKWERDVQRFREKAVTPFNSTLLQLIVFGVLMSANSGLAALGFYAQYGTIAGASALAILLLLTLSAIYLASSHYRRYIVDHKTTFDSVWLEVQAEYYGPPARLDAPVTEVRSEVAVEQHRPV